MAHAFAAVVALLCLFAAPPPAAAVEADGGGADADAGYDLYLRGEFAAAAGVFRRAAEGGDAEAQYMLGGLYALGQGVARDPARAHAWLTRAAEAGDAYARWVLPAVADLVPPPETEAPPAAPGTSPAPVAAPVAGPGHAPPGAPGGGASPPEPPAEPPVADPPAWAPGGPHEGGLDFAAARPGSAVPVASPAPLRTAAPRVPSPGGGVGDRVLAITGDDALDSLVPAAAWSAPRGQAAGWDGGPAASETVARIQRRLAAIGYDPGAADGVAGARTRIAIRTFQSDTGLPIDGRPSPALDAALGAAAGDDGLIATIQRRLNRLGFDAGPADGVMRPATRSALFAYYRSEGIAGVLGLDALARRLDAGLAAADGRER